MWIFCERQTYLHYEGEKSFWDVLLTITKPHSAKDNSALARAIQWLLSVTPADHKVSEVGVPATKVWELLLRHPICHLQYSRHGHLVINKYVNHS
jgi:hypothetical protein